DLHRAEVRTPTLRGAEQVGLHRRQHRRAVPLEDAAHGGGGLARTGRTHESERTTVTPPGRPTLIRLRRGLGSYELPAEAGNDEPARLRRTYEQRAEVASPGEPRASIHSERTTRRRADPCRARPVDDGPGQQLRERSRPGSRW